MVTSTEDLQGVVKQAHEAASELLKENPELGQIAFREILDHLLTELQPPTGNGGPAAASTVEESPSGIDDAYATEDQRAWAISQALQIGTDEVRDLFNLADAEPVLQMNSKRLSAKKSVATKEIALLVCSARTALGLDSGTDHIREAVDQHGRLDPSNFMKTLAAMEQIVMRGSPRSRNRLVRLRVIGVEEARGLAAKFTG